MYLYRNEETDKINLFESSIIGIRFLENGTNIVFDIDWSEGEKPIHVTCTFCSSIDFNFRHTDLHIGMPEITGFSYLKKGSRYAVQFDFDFTPMGYIRLDCENFIFEVYSEPLQTGGNNHRVPNDPMKKVI